MLPTDITGWMSPGELAWLASNMRGVCVEVGTYHGRSTCAMKNVDRLTCVDAWSAAVMDARNGTNPGNDDYHAFLSNLAKFPHRERIAWLRMPSVNATALFADGSLDSVFIDADHAYEAVRADIAAWLPKVKPGGLICGHDYGVGDWAGVKRAVDEVFASVGVWESVWFARVSA